MNYYSTIKVGLEGKLLKSTNCLIAPLAVQYSLSLGLGTVQNDPSQTPLKIFGSFMVYIHKIFNIFFFCLLKEPGPSNYMSRAVAKVIFREKLFEAFYRGEFYEGMLALKKKILYGKLDVALVHTAH